jgi:hypothetical protein
MKKVTLLNLSRVQKSVKGTDNEIYYLPPRSPKSLPAGIEVKEGLDKDIKVTVQQS